MAKPAKAGDAKLRGYRTLPVPRQSSCRPFSQRGLVRAANTSQGVRTFRAAVVFTLAGLAIGCFDPTQAVRVPPLPTGEASAVTACVFPPVDESTLETGERRAVVTGDPVIAPAPARGRAVDTARHLTCVGLAALMMGGSPLGNWAEREVAAGGNLHAVNHDYVQLLPDRAEDFVSSIGVNIHLSYFDRVYGSDYHTVILPRLRELGLRHLRDGGTSLPNEDWMRTVYDRWREVSKTTGARFTVIVSPRRSATGPGTNYDDMSHILDLRDRIGANNIAAWEGLNEHDWSGRPNWADEVRRSQRALASQVKTNPQMASMYRVLGPSLARPEHAGAVGDLSAFMDAGVMHPYDGGQPPATNLPAHVTGLRALNASRPLQATEVGYHTASASTNPWHWSLTELAQAKYTLRQYLELWNAGVQRSFGYELIDQGTDKTDMEANFGLLRVDGSRKPAFSGLRDLVALLGDPGAPPFATHPLRVSFSGDTAGVRRLLLEKADGRRFLLLWQNTSSYDKVAKGDIQVPAKVVVLGFDRPVTKATTYLPLSGTTMRGTVGNARLVTVPVPDHPVVVELVM